MRLCRPRVSPSTLSHSHSRSSSPRAQPLLARRQQQQQQQRQHVLIAQPTAADGGAGKIPVHFYFDILSPYSYFAFHTLLRYRDVWGLQLLLKPVFQGALIQATGNSPPALQPFKAPYLNRDIVRLSTYFDAPVCAAWPPSRMPAVLMGSLQVQRALVSLQQAHGDASLEKVLTLLWQRYLVEDKDIMQAESLQEVLSEAGLSTEQAQAVLAAATQPAAKQQLKRNTDEALKHGAFGVPTMVFPVPAPASSGGNEPANAGGENELQMVFGSDRFHVIAQLLGKPWLGPNPAAAAVTAAAGNKPAHGLAKRKIMSRL